MLSTRDGRLSTNTWVSLDAIPESPSNLTGFFKNLLHYLTLQCNSVYHRCEKLHEKDERGIIIRFIIKVIKAFSGYRIEDILYAS